MYNKDVINPNLDSGLKYQPNNRIAPNFRQSLNMISQSVNKT